MTKALLKLTVRLYRFGLSPLLHALCGPGCGCRFSPSCSAYLIEALDMHSVPVALRLGIRRIARCNPWGGSGFDPVPPADMRAKDRVESRRYTRTELRYGG